MSYIVSNKPLEDYNCKFNEFYISISDSYREIISEQEFILVEGFIYDLNKKELLSDSEIITIIEKYSSDNTVFPDNITGQFNIVYIKNNTITLINDFVGMKPLYYCIDNQKIIITNNIYSFLDFNFEYDDTAFLESFVGILYTPLNSRTYFKDVKQLRSGEYVTYNLLTNKPKFIVDSIDIKNKKIQKQDVNVIIDLLKENTSIYQNIFKELVLPISGGVDSRITLSSFDKLNINTIKTLSYGEADYIDNKIASKIASFLKLKHINISFQNSLFPTNIELNQQLKNGGEYFVNCWFSVIKELKKSSYISNKNAVVLIGDVLDILRAKNIKSIRSRKNRIKLQMNAFFGFKIKETELDSGSFENKIIQDYISKLSSIFKQYPELKLYFNYNENEFKNELKKDIHSFMDYIIVKTNPKNQLNLEEVFYIVTWGAKTMAKQVNIFKGNYNAFVLMSNRHLVKVLLNYNPLERFEDKLTHKLLKTKHFNYISHFPTSQIPFTSYNNNIYLKYILWTFRSLTDQFLIKSKKRRLIKHIEWRKYYENETNEKLLKDFLKDVKHKELPLSIFEKRKKGELWPLNETDINVYSFLLKLKSIKK